MARWTVFLVTHPLRDAGLVTKGARTMKGHVVRSLVTGAASLVLLTVAVSASRAAIAATLTLTPTVGPPTALVDASGSGFQARELVAFYFDRTRVGSARATRAGTVARTLAVPATALPGNHAITAKGLTSRLLARATFTVRTDWLLSCFEEGRSCYNPYENVIDRGDVDLLASAWTTKVGTTGQGSPIYADGLVFVGGSEGLYGLDPATGAIVINFTAAPVHTTPGVIRGVDQTDDRVIFGATDGNLYALSTTDGKLLWQTALGSEPTSPLVIEGFDSTDDKVLVGAGNTLSAFDSDGNKLWATVMEGGDISKAGAVMFDQPEERVIFAAGNTLSKVDAAEGTVLWTSAISKSKLGSPSIGNPAIVGVPNILVGDEDGVLYSVDPATGAVLSQFAAGGAIVGSPTISDPNLSLPWVFVSDSKGNIYAFDQTEEFPPPAWQAVLGDPIGGPPVLANGVLYVGTAPDPGDPCLFALDATSGEVLFKTMLTGRMASEPVVADGSVVIAIASGEVVLYDGPDS